MADLSRSHGISDRAPYLLVAGLLCSHCDGGWTPAQRERLAAIEREQQQRRTELANIQTQIADARRTLALAQRRAEYARCQASNSEQRAAATRAAAQCMSQRSTYAHCLARVAQESANGAMSGALIGTLFAMVTGGAGAIFMPVGGAMLGSGSAGNSEQCGVSPSCDPDAESVMRTQLAARGLSVVPLCGERPAGLNAICRVRMRTSFHLRPSETRQSVGSQGVGGEELELIDKSETIRRRTDALFLVRRNGTDEGWVFISNEQLSLGGCPDWLRVAVEPPSPAPTAGVL
jgi:hypothetical protein